MNRTSSTEHEHPLFPAARATARGFTLVELLVVIAIIAVLAMLGVSAIGRSIESSKSAKCAANLKQLAGAVMSYAADNNGMVPPAMRNADPAASGGSIWASALAPYVPTPPQNNMNRHSVYFCPCAKRPGMWVNSSPDYTCNDRADTNSTRGAFVQHAWLGAGASHPPQVRLAGIARPGQVIMFADAFHERDVKQSGAWQVFASRLETADYFGKDTLPVRGFAPRHYFRDNPVRGRFNAVFFDGHVESFDWHDPRLQDRAFRRSLVDTK
jgi:prepilin-type N-terminal cleavage/methylation domain-containing protein/prepilin-type processing-associated H-X9-DG protein